MSSNYHEAPHQINSVKRKRDLKIVDGIEILSELGVFYPRDQFWHLLTKLVEKKVANILEINNHADK